MKQITLLSKILILLLFTTTGSSIYAQSQFNDVITGASTSAFGRAPQGDRAVTRSVFIVTAAEMTAGGFTSGNMISGLGFNYETAQDIPTSGTIKIYLQNSTDTSNSIGTVWTSIISGMTLVSDAATTVPAAVGAYNIEFSNGMPFTYTGGSLYVAFDYQNLSNPVANNRNVSFCNNSPVGGSQGIFSARSAAGSTTPPTTLVGSNFRPAVKLGLPVACARPTNLGATNLTPTTVDLTWDPSSGGTGIELEFGPQGFIQGAGTTLTGAAVASPYTLTGLTPNTVYDYYVKTICATDESNWNGPFTFTSEFVASDLPYNTSLENDEFNYFGWRFQRDPNGTIGSFWQVSNFGMTVAQDGNYAARVTANGTNDIANDWIISRGVNLIAGQTVDVSFYVAVDFNTGTTPASYNLTVGTAQDANSQTTTIVSEPGFSNTTYDLKTHSFTPPADGVYYFGIQHATAANPNGSTSLFVDNFSVSAQTASTGDIDSSDFEVYPNPAVNHVSISSRSVSINTVAIIDINGRVIRSQNFDQVATARLDIADLSSGMYILNITSGNQTVTTKLVKE